MVKFWLSKGAKIYGISNNIPTNPSLYKILNIKNNLVKDFRVDIENYNKIKKIIKKINPDIVFHL